MKSYQVIRTHTSPYQSKNFHALEKNALEKIPGLSYVELSEAQDLPTILITNTHTQLKSLPSKVLAQTQLIVHPNSGYDHFADEGNIWKSIPMVVGHEIRAQAVAEYTIGSLMESLLELPQHISWNKERRWDRTLLKGLPVWIFGFGHIGKIVAHTLDTLGMKVTVIDPFASAENYIFLKSWREGHLSEARAVLVCCSLNKTSHHLFNQDFFNHAHPELIFINGARGKLVDEKSLREFLLTNPRAMAALDVFEQEPFGEEWHHFPQVWKTSHIAGVFKGLDDKILQFETDVIEDFLKLSEKDFMFRYQNEIIQNKLQQGILI